MNEIVEHNFFFMNGKKRLLTTPGHQLADQLSHGNSSVLGQLPTPGEKQPDGS